jgi:YD repeat-containing protein
VAGRAESAGRTGDQLRHVVAGRFLEEDPRGERCAREDIENDGELEGEEAEEAWDLREVQHRDVLGVAGADRSGRADRRRLRRLNWLLLPDALDGSTGELPADPSDVESDGAVSGEANEGQRLNQVPDDVGAAADRGDRLQERADRVAFRTDSSFLLPPQDRSRRDAAGLVLSVVDAAGVPTTYARDGLGRIASVTRLGRGVSFTYIGGTPGPTQLLGPGGAVLATYAYTPNGALETVMYPDGGGYRYMYDTPGRVVMVTDLEHRPLEAHEYDAQGRALTSEIAGGREKLSFAYTSWTKTTVLPAVRKRGFLTVGAVVTRRGVGLSRPRTA